LEKVLIKRIVVGCVVFAVLLSVFGLILLVSNFVDDSELKSSQAGLVALSDVKVRDGYSSSGVISLNIVELDVESGDNLELENILEE
jgi:hypothetical protein